MELDRFGWTMLTVTEEKAGSLIVLQIHWARTTANTLKMLECHAP